MPAKPLFPAMISASVEASAARRELNQLSEQIHYPLSEFVLAPG